MKTKRKISPLRISPFFCPKLGEDLKKKDLQSDFVRFCAPQTFCPSYKGGPCRNFTCYSMLIILYWRYAPVPYIKQARNHNFANEEALNQKLEFLF